MDAWPMMLNAPSPSLRAGHRGSDGSHLLSPAFEAHFLYTPDGADGLEGWRVRQLMPVECERLQGMPDDYTQVPYRGKPAADAPRHQAIGNSMAVPCMAWIGARLRQVMGQPGGDGFPFSARRAA